MRRAGFASWLAASAALVGLGPGAAAAPEFVRLSFSSARTDREITIAWNTANDVGTRVEYGVSSGSLTMSQLGTSFAATGAGLGYVHEVVLSGLAPGTTYYYRAGDPTDGFSPERQFTTGPAQHPECGAFRFLYIGDNRPDEIFGGGENYDAIMVQAMGHMPAFVLAGGDLVEDGMEPAQWRDFLGYTADVFDHAAFMPCIGNHDDGPGQGDEAYYNQIFALPRSEGSGASGTEDFYYFLFGNTIVASLSTQTFPGGEIPFADQAAWLDQVLTDHPKRWKIVMLHHPLYTYGIFVDISSPPNEVGQNAALTPILDKHHVDVVVTSHNHWYERYEPSACATQGDPGSDQPCSVGDTSFDLGTVYLVSGGAGAFTIPGVLCGGPPGRAVCSGDHHYLVFDVTSDSLTMEAWGAAPQPNDRFDIMTITKPPPASCDPPPLDAGPGLADSGAPGDSGAPDGRGGDVDAGPGGPGGAEDGAGCCSTSGPRRPMSPGSLVLAIGVALFLRRRGSSAHRQTSI